MSDTATKPARRGTPAEPALHDRDLHAWSIEQARLLRQGRLSEIDAENIAEEIADVGKAEYRVLESALRVLLVHMLKWDHQPERRSRSWQNTIAEQRERVRQQIHDNPSLASRIDDAVERAYRRARLRASSETDLDVERFPDACPYGSDAIMERVFEKRAEP